MLTTGLIHIVWTFFQTSKVNQILYYTSIIFQLLWNYKCWRTFWLLPGFPFQLPLFGAAKLINVFMWQQISKTKIQVLARGVP